MRCNSEAAAGHIYGCGVPTVAPRNLLKFVREIVRAAPGKKPCHSSLFCGVSPVRRVIAATITGNSQGAFVGLEGGGGGRGGVIPFR